VTVDISKWDESGARLTVDILKWDESGVNSGISKRHESGDVVTSDISK